MQVLLVDDHPMVLHSLSGLLQADGHTVTTSDSYQHARALLLKPTRFDLLLLDYHLPDGSAFNLLQETGIQIPGHVVIISGISDAEEVLYILEKSPAKAFIPKDIDFEDLAIALQQAVLLPDNGGSWVWQIDKRAFMPGASAYPKETMLSPKEREVFMLLRQGLLDKQIASQLSRSIHTIRVQIRSIKRKRGSTRRAEVQR